MFNHYWQVQAFFENRQRLGMKPGLDRIQKLLHFLGDPQEKVAAIHVAGTNGKGSTIQFIKNGLIANGFRVGVFESPSMNGITGHMSVNQHRISENTILTLMNQVYPYIQQLDKEENAPTVFEIMTAIAFVYFAENVDLALVEAGMGGRYDTTNCFDPILSIITNVEKDHTAFLGDTLEDIAWQKAGIIKENRPVIAGEMNEKVYGKVIAEAIPKNAPVFPAGQAFQSELLYVTRESQTFQWQTESFQPMNISMKALGSHQIKNASLAVMALAILDRSGFSLDWDKAIDGLGDTMIPGRLEYICDNPTVILDSAHNPAGAEALTKALPAQCTDADTHLVFAAFRDKDMEGMLRRLEKHFSTITLTTFEHPRAASITELQRYSRHSAVRFAEDWHQAVNRIFTQQKNGCYVVTGSLHFITNVRQFLKETMLAEW
ncbi:bifunctional folylpolyglutamate synthase/dihydrofolate synthase [Lentibacillus lipolyticus]|nr:bifunctional folylpolyglutamate synthase/dihydrofolate synthase [Lentibacillus lipolyticus]